jgi:PhnB protein
MSTQQQSGREQEHGGRPTVSPYLIVSGAQRMIGFMERVFGGELVRRFDGPDGTLMHAEVRIGNSIVMLGEAGGEWQPVQAVLHVYVADVDSTWRAALEAGARPVQEPVRKEGDEDRRGGFLDPAGNSWWVATPVAGGAR